MKKLLTILFLFCFAYSFGQTPYFFDRSSGVNTVIDIRGGAKLNWYNAYNISDTSLNGGLDTLGAQLHVRSGALQGLWIRDSVSTGGHQWRLLSFGDRTYWTLNGTSLYPNLTTYNVGIGTVTPTHKIDVVSGTGLLFFDGTRLGLYDAITRNNVLVGQLTGQSLSTTYTDAIFIGGSAGRFATGNYNVAIGTGALTNGNNGANTAVGYKSLYLTDSSDNTALGYLSGITNYGTRNVTIGSRSGNYQAAGSSAVNNTEIQTSSTVITGGTTGTFISSQSLSVGATYSLLLHFNGTAPEPYNSSGITDLYALAVITNANTLTLTNAANFTTQGTSTTTFTVYSKQNNSIAIGYNVQSTASNEIAIGNTSNTLLRVNNFIVDLTDVPTSGQALIWNGTAAVWDTITGGGGGSYSFVSPLINTAGIVTIQNALADGSTKGAATFNASDFNASGGGVVTLDYNNGQASDATHKGFLPAADFVTFAAKLSNITGYLSAGTNVTVTGSGTLGSPYVINSSSSGGITTLNTLTASTQFFAIGSTGTSPSWSVSGGNTHSLNLPTTSASNTGLVTPTLFNTWNAKQDLITGAITTVTTSNLTSNRAVISNGTGKIDVSTTTSTDLTNFVLAHTSQTLTDGATITMNCASGYLGKVTLGGNRTLAITNNTNGYDIVIEVIQDGTGNRTLTLPSSSLVPIGFGSGTTINLSTAGGAKDIIYGKYDGTNYFWTLVKSFQ